MTDEILKRFPENGVPANKSFDEGTYIIGGREYWKVKISLDEQIGDMKIHSENGELFSLILVNDN